MYGTQFWEVGENINIPLGILCVLYYTFMELTWQFCRYVEHDFLSCLISTSKTLHSVSVTCGWVADDPDSQWLTPQSCIVHNSAGLSWDWLGCSSSGLPGVHSCSCNHPGQPKVTSLTCRPGCLRLSPVVFPAGNSEFLTVQQCSKSSRPQYNRSFPAPCLLMPHWPKQDHG